MSTAKETTAFLLEQCRRYPALQVQDLLKGLHQSAFGCGHFVTDAGMELLRQELLCPGGRADIEPLDGDYCRVHLGYLKESGLAPETLFRLFVLSAREPSEETNRLEGKLAALLEAAEGGALPFSPAEVRGAVEDWRSRAFPALHHSPAFRAAHHPAYRVIRKDFARLLPLLAAIDQRRADRERVLVAIEGGAGSGKSTLADLLARIWDCNVFHMDDYFLRPEQRTPERLAEVGGNVDRERFYQEVLRPLTQGGTVRFQRFDCRTGSLQPQAEAGPKALTIVEGAYSTHPAFGDCYDLSVFLRIPPELQRQRILARNGKAWGQRFFDEWIPMEQRYFEQTRVLERCDLILEAEA